MPPAPKLTLNQLARLIDTDPATLTAPVEPENGLRVWGRSGIGTIHHDGRIRMAVLHRRVHTVEQPP